MSDQNPYLIPAQTPPPGVTPDFNRYYANVPIQEAFSYTFFALATLGFGARIFTRAYVVRKVEFEDYFLAMGWIGYAILEGFKVTVVHNGAGRHQWDVNLISLVYFLWDLNVTSITYNISILFLKFSILVQLQRIFAGTKKGFVWWAINILQVTNALFYAANLVTAIFACNPREKIWLPWIPGTCINSNVSIFVSCVFNLVSDVAMLVIPLYAISQLKLSRERKLGVFAIFATGILGCVGSALRLYFNVTLLTTNDFTFAYGSIGVAVSVEYACLILVASFPILPRLLLFIKQRRAQKSIPPPQLKFARSEPESKATWVSPHGQDIEKNHVLVEHTSSF